MLACKEPHHFIIPKLQYQTKDVSNQKENANLCWIYDMDGLPNSNAFEAAKTFHVKICIGILE